MAPAATAAGRARVLPRAAGGAVPLGAIALVYAFAVGTRTGRDLDGDALARVASWRLEAVADPINHLLNPVTAALAAILLVAVTHARHRRAGRLLAALLIGCNASAWGLERALEAIDPLGGEHQRALGPGYFPSGHAAAAMSLAIGAVLAVPPAHRLAAVVSGAAGTAVLGWAVVGSGSHTPADVIGGFLFAAAWGSVARPRSAAGAGTFWPSDVAARAPTGGAAPAPEPAGGAARAE